LSQLLRAIPVPVSAASLRLRATRRARSPSGLVVYGFFAFQATVRVTITPLGTPSRHFTDIMITSCLDFTSRFS
jgi:hypothetical protein